jgi:hypothetical protein
VVRVGGLGCGVGVEVGGVCVKDAVITYESWMLLNVYDETAPTEVPFTATSDIW